MSQVWMIAWPPWRIVNVCMALLWSWKRNVWKQRRNLCVFLRASRPWRGASREGPELGRYIPIHTIQIYTETFVMSLHCIAYNLYHNILVSLYPEVKPPLVVPADSWIPIPAPAFCRRGECRPSPFSRCIGVRRLWMQKPKIFMTSSFAQIWQVLGDREVLWFYRWG